jgi:hypothetical protein
MVANEGVEAMLLAGDCQNRGGRPLPKPPPLRVHVLT